MNAWTQIVASISAQPAQHSRKVKEPVPEKKCTTCGIIKKRADFYARSDHSPNCLMSRCKECFIAAAKKKRQTAKSNYKIGDNSIDPVAKFEWPDD